MHRPMTEPAQQSGRLIAGYRLGAVIGVGGKGIVYEATEVARGLRVALKLVPITGPRDIPHREAASIGALDHPNVVRVYQSGEAEGLRFLAMELVDGATLQDRLRRADITIGQALGILSVVASALDAAHLAGLVHRDVKPSNILIDRRGKTYLADFGIAQPRQDAARTKVFVGTAAYAAPEQFLGDPVTPASDVYALTAILYECIAGQPPFQEPTLGASVIATLTGTPRGQTGEGPSGLPLDVVLRRGLAVHPDDRFSRATDLMAAARLTLRDALPDMLRRTAGRGVPRPMVSDRPRSAHADAASGRATE